MIFVLEVDSKGKLIHDRQFPDSDRAAAREFRMGIELANLAKGVLHEVVTLESPSRDDLMKTHRRYFVASIAELKPKASP